MIYYAKSEVLELESNLLFLGGGYSTMWNQKCLSLSQTYYFWEGGILLCEIRSAWAWVKLTISGRGVIYYVKSEALELESNFLFAWGGVIYYMQLEGNFLCEIRILDLESNLPFHEIGNAWIKLTISGGRVYSNTISHHKKNVIWGIGGPFLMDSAINVFLFSRLKHFQFHVVDYPLPPRNSKFDSRSSTSDFT